MVTKLWPLQNTTLSKEEQANEGEPDGGATSPLAISTEICVALISMLAMEWLMDW